jgi:predicted NAD/FAD-dependent oxidoreductase
VEKMASFAVIGAGMAGISLANRLKKAGHHSLVFEKSRGRGGRLSTRRSKDWQVDHGTQYFTARSPKFKEEVQSWLDQGWAKTWQIDPWIYEKEALLTSPDDEIRYVGMPTMNAMVHGLSEDIEVYTETRIDRLEKQGQQWRIWDEHGEHYGLFDAVLLTAPLAQSMALLPEESLAESQLRLANMSPTWAYAIALSEPSGIGANAIFSRDGIVNWAAKDSSKPGRPQTYETWALHFSPAWSSNHLDASEELLEFQAMHLLQQLAGKELKVHAAFKHRWLYARSGSTDLVIPQWDDAQNIGLAGDWTLGSRLEDAWLSAQILADRLIERF